jgi:RNA recognition motif-containing protein
MRPVFCGNFDFDARQSDLERLFSKYGPIRRIDMKSGTHRHSLPPSLSPVCFES